VPEGDTLRRTAAGLRPWLVGHTVRRFWTPVVAAARDGRGLEGQTVRSIEAVGKHLLIRFSGGRALRTHLRMAGSWHLYRPGERWRKPRRRARAVLETDDAVAVCFDAPEVEILTGGAAERGGRAAHLGPDLLDPSVDLDEVAERWRHRPHLPVGVALLRQSLAAGIGNVYKSEVLFLCGVDPFVRVGTLDVSTLRELAVVARREMRRNLVGGPRRTRRGPGSRLWVYGRSGRPCLRCGTPVRMRRQGEDGRSTYFCPSCQPRAPTE
jgi:endonuclease-8